MKRELKKIEKEVKALFGVKYVDVEIQENYFDNHYYDTNDNIYDSSECWFEDIEFPEESIKEEIKELKDNGNYDDDDIEYEARHNLLENLAYWTIYFKPRCEDVDTALKCGLTPFYYQDEFYLALNGCGMDLSPKLDAYQALCSETIPKSSNLFSQEDYFSYVVGKKITKEVRKAIKREEKRVILSFNVA